MCFDQEKMQGVDPRALRDFERQRKERIENLRETMPENSCGQAGRTMTDAEIVAEFFKYHPPNESTIPKYTAINQAAKNFAEVLLANCPGCADRSAAIRLIRDARMTANAAIALDGLSL